MMIQNCLKLLNELSSIENEISIMKNKILEHELDVDYENLLNKIVNQIADQ